MVDYSDAIERLSNIHHSQFWMCERTLCAKLGFTFARENDWLPDDAGTLFPHRSLLTDFLSNLKKGNVTTGVTKLGIIDVASVAPNPLNMYYQVHNKITQWNSNQEKPTTNRRRIFSHYGVSANQQDIHDPINNQTSSFLLSVTTE